MRRLKITFFLSRPHYFYSPMIWNEDKNPTITNLIVWSKSCGKLEMPHWNVKIASKESPMHNHHPFEISVYNSHIQFWSVQFSFLLLPISRWIKNFWNPGSWRSWRQSVNTASTETQGLVCWKLFSSLSSPPTHSVSTCLGISKPPVILNSKDGTVFQKKPSYNSCNKTAFQRYIPRLKSLWIVNNIPDELTITMSTNQENIGEN